ncbi:LysM peptidoglycan-binding domain-containing protein [Bizionia sediminis]|uniref:LysM peptidoglycan-binding domain-containing protein n=1 Tax=Bizionia sediminis TaxID=1737064 RepID=A0ABW5KPV0_9FLAO
MMKKIFYMVSMLFVFMYAATATAQNYKTHKVKAGETIASIANKYQTTAEAIYALNPDAKKELKRHAVLIIPSEQVGLYAPQATINKELTGFITHKVKRKETLFSLAKQYNITQDELKKHNPFLYANNLRKGDELKIPEYKRVLTISEQAAADTTTTYTVLPKEGKWRIAYKFGITVAELEALNPNMGPVLQEGALINVPKRIDSDIKPIDNRFSYYEVLPKEGFYRLKVKLGVEQAELEALNPGLAETGLKVGMILKVPNNTNLDASSTQAEASNLTNNITNFNEKHIAIMLPFRLQKVTIDSVADTQELIQKDPFLNTSLDFYSGMVVALDSLKKLGLNLKVDVYDTKNMASEVTNILNENNFDSVHAVIGPFMPDNVKRVSEKLQELNTPVVSPLTKQVALASNVFQSRPSEDLLKDKIINFVKNDSSLNQIIVIADQGKKEISNNLKSHFPGAIQIFSRKDKDDNDAFYIYDTDIIPKLKPGKNVVFLETTSSGFVSNVTSKLNSLRSKDIQIVLATTNMGSAFEDDDVSNYHLSNLQFTFATIAKTYNEDDKNSFAEAYQERFGVTPNKLAVRGFDITMDVVLRLVHFNNLYESVQQAPLTEYVENKFAYKKQPFGGYYNDTVYLVKYNDLKIEEIKQ